MDSNNCQVQKQNRFITFLDRKSLAYRQSRASTRSHAQKIKLFEVIPEAAGRGST